MPIRVKIAKTPGELDSLFQTRHYVFVEEEGYLKERPDRRIYDRFDALPTSANFVAMVNEQVVGGLRVTEWSEAGTPAEEFFDFSRYVPSYPNGIASASMLCLLREYRDLPRLCYMLLCLGTYWAISRSLSHVVASINPVVERLIRSIGFKPVGPTFYDQEHGVDVLPTILDLSQISESFLEMAKFQGFHDSLRTFDREYYRAGERIIEFGTKRDAAYVIVDGQVSVSRPGRRADDPPNLVFSTLGPGEIFGELYFLTNKPQSTDVTATTDVDLMVIERDVFWEQLLGNPDLQLRLLQLVGHRLVDTIEKF